MDKPSIRTGECHRCTDIRPAGANGRDLSRWHRGLFRGLAGTTDRHSRTARTSVVRLQADQAVVRYKRETRARLTTGVERDTSSEEHTSELQSPSNNVCRLLLDNNTVPPRH